jgi:hypothetical protein
MMNDHCSIKPIVTSAEEGSSSDTDEQESYANNNANANANSEDLFLDASADDVDEAFVYQQLRGGIHEPITIKSSGTNQTISVLKPRKSDAVLSCPCCFQIVCMDCQRHERYADQYRAMFVMGITVAWNTTLLDTADGLVELDATSSASVVVPHAINSYVRVNCANCQTQVAALDMTDEVYHFYGCLSSS